MQDLKLALIQTNPAWEDVDENLVRLNNLLDKIQQPVDAIVLPEMFNTGFSMNVNACAETPWEKTMHWMKTMAQRLNCAVAGSLLISEGGAYFNRFLWMLPNGQFEHYDKRHLFTMVGEHNTMSAGKEHRIVHFRGWKLSLQVCYDLRFPVWSKNTLDEGVYEYDALIYVANWPEIRKHAYMRLLPARAIENQCYAVWVNRVGADGNGYNHSGDASVYDPTGACIVVSNPYQEEILYASLSADALRNYRQKFQFGRDWDAFRIIL